MSAGGRSLRDPASRKLPARFAESELEPIKPSAGDKTLVLSTSEEPGSPGDDTRGARSGSPITPGPPAGYEPPPSSGTSSVAAPSSKKKTTAIQTPRAVVPDEVPRSDADEEEEEEIEAPTSAQRPRARIYVPAKPLPDSAVLDGEKVLASSSTRRFQPDRDDDFFLRRKVIRDVESNPPPQDPIDSSGGEDQSDEEFVPAKKTTTRRPPSIKRAEEQPKKNKGKERAANTEEEEAELEQDQADDSEEDGFEVVESTSVRSSLSPTKASSSSVRLRQTSLSPLKGSPTKARSSTSSKVTSTKSAKGGKAKAKDTVTSDKKQTTLTRNAAGSLTPEDYLARAKTVWRKAHEQANARMQAESAGLHYTPPSHPASKYYLYYEEPYLKQHIDPGRDELGIGWTCRCCPHNPYVAWRAFTDTSTSLFSSHVGTNKAKINFDTVQKIKDGKAEGPLERYLIKKPEQLKEEPVTQMQIRTIAVGWITEERRPISILGDKWLRKLLPEQRRELLPSRNTTTQDISDMYEAMQTVVAERLAAVQGCIHIALDIWTSANGHSYLGIIGCWQENGQAQRHVLDMKVITKRHTAEHISVCLKAVLQQLKIEEKVWFIASDNASTNTAMMRILGKDDSLPRIEGEATQIRCIAHILNLISEVSHRAEIIFGDSLADSLLSSATPSQSVLRPFNKAVRDVAAGVGEEEDEEGWASEDDDIDMAGDNSDALEDDDAAVSNSLHPSLSQDSENEGLIRRALAAKKVAYTQSNQASSASGTQPPQPTKELRVDSGEVGIQIRQLAWFARKLRYNTPLRQSFQETCVLFKMPKPHSLIRDVATRWNSTLDMIERALDLWDAIVAWQEANVKLIPAKFRIKRSHKASFKRLVQILKPLSDATYKFSAKSITTIADVVGTFEELDAHYRAIEDDEDQPAVWREAARRAGAVCATYYGLADASKIHYLAVLLHPNLRTKFMRLMKWEKSWITKAEQTLQEVFEERYKIVEQVESQTPDRDDEQHSDSTVANNKKKKKPESFVERQLALAEEESTLPEIDAIAEWCKGSVPLVKGKMVDALSWWWDQKRIGANHGGLTDLALDIFSAPATSVDVERLFSRAGHHITPLRHRLKAIKLGHIVTVGGWFREDWIPENLLTTFHHQKQQAKLAADSNSKRKRTELTEQPEAGPAKRAHLEDHT
ncbi:hypothetical protein CF319_g6786 [Tilletia indica]|nr:hypothetical protein CF319_g6786 [Tilletia indica]